MIIRTLPYICLAMLAIIVVMPARAAVEIGKPAPAITATDINGNAFDLSAHKGKIVVLEWFNKGCPYVQKHYDGGNMQKLQTQAKADGIEWVTIISSAEGQQGYVTADEAKTDFGTYKSEQSAILLDPQGTIGKAYDAKTTPHMFVIDAQGNLAYAGAIDSNSSANPATIADAENYVTEALNALKAGEAVKTTTTTPYGCGVKYAH